MNETVAATEKAVKAKQLLLGFIDPAWINMLMHPMVIFMLVFALAILFLARTGLWRAKLDEPKGAEAAPAKPATKPIVTARMPVAPPSQSVARPADEPLAIVSMGGIEELIARQHAETADRADRALAISEEALRLHAAALDELARMNDLLTRLVQQVDGAQACSRAGVVATPASASFACRASHRKTASHFSGSTSLTP